MSACTSVSVSGHDGILTVLSYMPKYRVMVDDYESTYVSKQNCSPDELSPNSIL